MENKPGYDGGIKSMRTGFSIIEYLRDEQGARLSDIASGVGIADSTAHAYLATFQELDLVIKEDGQFRLSLKPLDIGMRAREHYSTLLRTAEPVVDQLVAETEETAKLFDDQYEGEVIIGETAAITIPQVLMHLLDTDQIDTTVDELNNPSQDLMDEAIDFLIEEANAGQFRTSWEAYGESVTVMASEEAVLGDVWQPAAMDIRRDGTPCTYATMEEGIQGYRFWYGGIVPLSPAVSDRRNRAEVQQLIDVHYGAAFPGYIQGWGYSVPHYENEDLVRDGSDDTGEGMGPEYYDWSYRGEGTYDPVDEPALFDPQEYDWSDEEGDPDPDGGTRDSGPIEERFDRVGFFQIWPDEAEYMTDRWRDFLAA